MYMIPEKRTSRSPKNTGNGNIKNTETSLTSCLPGFYNTLQKIGFDASVPERKSAESPHVARSQFNAVLVFFVSPNLVAARLVVLGTDPMPGLVLREARGLLPSQFSQLGFSVVILVVSINSLCPTADCTRRLVAPGQSSGAGGRISDRTGVDHNDRSVQVRLQL
jgi:hypothetical protein